jgi:UDP-GlcNAc:undecaprenyl-phosphate GlcNAc-1-phosphate transferase
MRNESVLISILIFVFSFLLCGLLIPAVMKLALKKNWVARPNHRTVHNGAIPWDGGIALYISFLFSMTLVFLLKANPAVDTFLPIIKIMVPATLILCLGFFDDLKGLRARQKLLAEIGAGFILFAFGIRIEGFGNVFSTGYLPFAPMLSLFLTVLWILLITNAINLIDGLDGLAAGIIAISSLVLFLIDLNGGGISSAGFIYLGIFGSVSAFLKYNSHPAKIFMGDCGSLFLGFLLAATSILAHQKSTLPCSLLAPLIVMGIPLIDTGWTIIRRIFNHQGIFTPDKNHIHHRLLKAGFSQRKTAIVLWVYTLILGGISLFI